VERRERPPAAPRAEREREVKRPQRAPAPAERAGPEARVEGPAGGFADKVPAFLRKPVRPAKAAGT
jgi:hypothetical protein